MEMYFSFPFPLPKVRRVYKVGDALIPVSLFNLVLLIPTIHSSLYFPLVAFMDHAVAFRNLDWIFVFFCSVG